MGCELLEEFRNMLKKADLISIGSKRSKNYFEVAGYPHYENVASSILAFFFDTDEEHGLRDLWLRSLIECYRDKGSDSAVKIGDISSYETIENGVIREDVTSANKRIDIVIQTKNDFVVAIENKIYAGVNNPFGEYSERLNKSYSQYTHKIEIVLSLKSVEKDKSLSGVDCKGNKYHFINITYRELLAHIQKNIGEYLLDANEKWIIYMNEFIKNIESLQEDKMIINQEWQSFLEENNELIKEYNRKIKADQDAKVSFVKDLSTSLQRRFDDASTGVATTAFVYGTQSFSSYLSLVVDITKGDTVIAIEPYFYKPGYDFDSEHHLGIFYTSIWVRQKGKREECIPWLESVLKKEGFQFKKMNGTSWGDYFELKTFDFSNVITNQEVEDYLFDFWSKIVESIKA